ncbi:MAG TPA: hypothetical protein VF338_12675, partial [Leptolinea sp.]
MTVNNNLVLFNGDFHTLNPANPLVSAVSVRDGKFIYLGDAAGARAVFPYESFEAVDLKGATVIPGLTDAH